MAAVTVHPASEKDGNGRVSCSVVQLSWLIAGLGPDGAILRNECVPRVISGLINGGLGIVVMEIVCCTVGFARNVIFAIGAITK